MSLLSELQRRNVFRVAAAYLVVGWLLTEVLTTILPELGAPEFAGRLVILIFALGFIPVVVLSWVFELTPEGIVRESTMDDEIRRPRNRAFDYTAIGVVILLVIAVAWLGARGDGSKLGAPGAAVSAASVAVLPFVNMSEDSRNEYFSDGLTETLLHMLTQLPDLKVAARTSSFAFKGRNVDVREIASTLQVAHILEGSVQQAGDRVRITAQLIRADDGFHVWSSVYDRTLDDIFRIQDEIAGEVRQALSKSLLGDDEPTGMAGVGTESTDAYDLYLQAMGQKTSYSYGELQASADLLKGALAIDPDYLDAKVQLASNYHHQVETGLMPLAAGLAEVRTLTDDVLSVRPDDPLARALNHSVALSGSAREVAPQLFFDSISEMEKLIALHPDEAEIRFLLARRLQGALQFDRAAAVLTAGLERDPLNARLHYELGRSYSLSEDFEKARESLMRALEIEPGYSNAYFRLARVSFELGDGVDYVRQLLNAMRTDPRDHEASGSIAEFLYLLGLVEEGNDFRTRVLTMAPESPIAYKIDLFRAQATGNEAESIASARRAVRDNIEDRNSAFSLAVQYLMRVAARNGTVAETEAFLDESIPGIFDMHEQIVSDKYRRVQVAAFDGWYVALPRDEFLRRVDSVLEYGLQFGVDAMEDPRSRMIVEAFRGNTEASIRAALDGVLSKPVTEDLQYRDTFAQPYFSDIVADPRIASALAAWDDEFAAMREDVRRFLVELSGGEAVQANAR